MVSTASTKSYHLSHPGLGTCAAAGGIAAFGAALEAGGVAGDRVADAAWGVEGVAGAWG